MKQPSVHEQTGRKTFTIRAGCTSTCRLSHSSGLSLNGHREASYKDMSPTKKGPAEEPKAQGSSRRLPPPLPNSPRPIKSSLPADATTGMGSNNPFRNRSIDLDTTPGARTNSEAALGHSTGPREAMSPGSEVTPAMGSLTMSYAGATSSRGGPVPQNSAMSSSAKLPSSSKPSSVALGNLVHSPPRNSPPSVFHGGKLVINRSADHGRSGSISSLQPSYAEGASGRKPFHSPASSTRATLPAEPVVHERGLGLNESTGAPLPPPYIPSPTGAVIVAEPDLERMDVDHVEILDPDSALDQISLDDERIENTARFVNRRKLQGGYMTEGSTSSDEDEPELNKGTVMFSNFDWDRARKKYNTKRANEACSKWNACRAYETQLEICTKEPSCPLCLRRSRDRQGSGLAYAGGPAEIHRQPERRTMGPCDRRRHLCLHAGTTRTPQTCRPHDQSCFGQGGRRWWRPPFEASSLGSLLVLLERGNLCVVVLLRLLRLVSSRSGLPRGQRT